MKIGDVARAADVTTWRIRFHERRGISPAAPRGTNGYLEYFANLVEMLRIIEPAQDLGFSQRDIARLELGTGPHFVSCKTAIGLLGNKLEAVTALIDKAEARRARIESLLPVLRDRHPRAAVTVTA